jgi:hypothetical protein
MASKDIEPHKFPKGTSGNPNGRPKKLPQLDKLLADVLGEEKDGVSAAEAILKKLRQMASQGNLRAAEILLDRGYGKAKQHTDITTDGQKLPSVTIIRPPLGIPEP